MMVLPRVTCHVSRVTCQVCGDCRDEFCDGTCIVFQYDSYQVELIYIKIYKSSN